MSDSICEVAAKNPVTQTCVSTCQSLWEFRGLEATFTQIRESIQ